MRLSVLTIFILVLSFSAASGQKSLANLRLKLLNADSIVLVSHELTAGIAIIDTVTKKDIPLPKLVNGSKRNEKIIRETVALNDFEKTELIKIITRPFEDSIITRAGCFLPHHAILVYSGKKISFIDVCFGCRGIETSKDIKVTSDDFDDRKWEELFSLFKGLKFKYELDEEQPMQEDETSPNSSLLQ